MPVSPLATFAGHRAELADLGDDVLAAVSGLGSALDRVFDAVTAWGRTLINSPTKTDGLVLACTQAENELIDLLYDAVHGRGRPALKASRSLFELLVTVLDVIADPTLRGRYEDHRWVVFALDAELQSAKPPLRKGDAHWRAKALKVARRELAAVIGKYGPGFRRSWRPGTLADAAARWSLQADYDFYRLGSGVLHGSAGGVLGQYALVGDDAAPVHRTGPALSLCPDALRQGVTYFRQIVDATRPHVGDGGVGPVLDALDALLALLDDFERYMTDVDAVLWRDAPRNVVLAIAAVDTSGGCRWFQYDTARHEMRLAETPPDIPTLASETVADIQDARRSGRPVEHVGPDEIVTIAVAGLKLVTRPGAAWEPAGRYLQQASPSATLPVGFLTINRKQGFFRRDE